MKKSEKGAELGEGRVGKKAELGGNPLHLRPSVPFSR